MVHIAASADVGLTPLVAEVMAMCLACLEAAKFTPRDIIVEGDSLQKVNVVLGKGPCAWEIDLIITDIRCILARFRDAKVCHIFREANSVGDKIATLRHNLPPE